MIHGIEHITPHLSRNETVVDSKHIVDDENLQLDFEIHLLQRPGLTPGDEVLLSVNMESEVCVLIGGNALELSVESGQGVLNQVHLETGSYSQILLKAGDQTEVSPKNTMYWYENLEGEPFIIRDHCDDFDPSHEPSIDDVVSTLRRTLLQTVLGAL